MRLLFDPDFDLGAWPGPRGTNDAVAGSLWVGTEGLLSTLETHLGLTAPHAAIADRAAALVPRLFRDDRFYGASAKADPWATAHRLLAWRDHLWEHGWRGEHLGERRLGELAEVTLGLSAGTAERLEVVAGWLGGRSVDIAEIAVLAPRESHSPILQSVFAALERGGTSIVERGPPESETSGNLEAVRGSGALSPGDTSLQLFRPYGPREAARAIAAALAADRGFEETLFVSPDGVLDDALGAFGLPTLGCRSTYAVGGLSEILPMTLRLAWSPMDPQIALDWLTLPDSPIDRSLARQLAGTLENWPAVGNPAWQTVIAEKMPASNERRRSDLAALDIVFSPVAERNGEVRVRDLVPRIELLERWASSHASTSPGQGYETVLVQAQSFRRRFALAELTRLSTPRLEAILQSIAGDGETTRNAALVGYSSVGRPGGMVGPAPRVIWWQFHDSGSMRRARVALRESERTALANAGVRLPVLSDEVGVVASRARRPLLLAQQTLILVSPLHDETGEPAHPHPLWDEIVGRLSDPRAARHLIVDEPTLRSAPARSRVGVTSPVPPARAHRTSLPLVARASESPTSLAKLLGCSFAYAVEYLGRIHSRSFPRIVAENRLFGSLAHEVLASVARGGGLSGGSARETALDVLERTLTTHAALLLLPGYQHELVLLRDAVGGAASLLARVMETDRLRVSSVEMTLQASLGGRVLGGTPDLVLEDCEGKLVLLDLKWSGASYRTDELRASTALQLSAYAALLAATGRQVRTLGYLVLRGRRLLVRGAPLAFAQQIHPELLTQTWIAAGNAWTERANQLSAGDIFVEGIATLDHVPPEDAVLDGEGRLSLPPPCRFCALDLLCGLTGGSS